jgi:3-hydroxyisobutyrate dehydrogenase-like beta-hydroxyacid dehydrogenase
MNTVGIVSPGFMGAGLGGALRAGGARVVATVEGRSPRTRRLAEEAGLELLPTLRDVVGNAGVVLVVTPPGEAVAAARAIRAAAEATQSNPLVADLNAVSPTTMTRVADELKDLRLVDGSISGPPPSDRPGARLYFSGPEAAAVAGLPWDGQVEPIVLGDRVGSASALKMCTGSVYKGLIALVTQAMRTAGAYGVLEEVVSDLDHAGLAQTAGVARGATKAWRYVAEMREVAATQEGAGLTPELFAAIAGIFDEVSRTELAQDDPEVSRELSAAEVVRLLQH